MEKVIFVCLRKLPNQSMCTEYLLCGEEGEGGLERTCNANFKVFYFILELKWETRALG